MEEDGAAAEAGIRPGDIVTSVNQKKVGNLADYSRAMKEAEQRGSAVLLVRRGDASIFFALRIR